MKDYYQCPYCSTEHSFSDVEFRCINGFCTKKEQDEQYARYLNMQKSSMPMTNITFRSRAKIPFFMKDRYMPVWEECPHCKMKSTVRVCPTCHNELPEGIQDHEDMLIAVVGSRDVGKTHFIAVLIHELQNRICPDVFDGTFNPVNDATFQHYMNDFYNTIYVKQEVQPLTATGMVRGLSSVRTPLIYEMILPLDKKGKRKKKFTFVFYDTAGEDGKNKSSMRTINRYICRASGLIFLLDPMQILEIRGNMTVDEIRTSTSISQREIEPQEMVLKRIAELIRETRGWSYDRPIDIPTAITFSKFDVLKRLFPAGSTVLQPSGYIKNGHLDKEEWFNVSTEIDAMLRQYKARSFIKYVEDNFKNYSYCAVSALGQQPMVSGSSNKKLRTLPAPHRVEDPFLWLLNKNGILKEK